MRYRRGTRFSQAKIRRPKIEPGVALNRRKAGGKSVYRTGKAGAKRFIGQTRTSL